MMKKIKQFFKMYVSNDRKHEFEVHLYQGL